MSEATTKNINTLVGNIPGAEVDFFDFDGIVKRHVLGEGVHGGGVGVPRDQQVGAIAPEQGDRRRDPAFPADLFGGVVPRAVFDHARPGREPAETGQARDQREGARQGPEDPDCPGDLHRRDAAWRRDRDGHLHFRGRTLGGHARSGPDVRRRRAGPR